MEETEHLSSLSDLFHVEVHTSLDSLIVIGYLLLQIENPTHRHIFDCQHRANPRQQ